MDNPIPAALPQLFALTEDAADGAKDHGAAIGLKQNTETDIRADLAAARGAEEIYGKAKTAKDTFSTNLRIADSNARSFIKSCSAYFSETISEDWSAAWSSTGFPNQSTAVPPSQDERFSLMGSLITYFTDNPNMEVNTPKLVLTAVKAKALNTALIAARKAVNDGNTDAGTKRDARDAAVEDLKTRLRGLIAELSQLLDDNSPVWDAFGLNEPGASGTPDVPEALVLTPGGAAGTFHADWAHARNAARYHVWVFIVGVDTAYRNVATVTDTDATLTGLPSGKTAKIQITAVNDAGESAPSAEVSAVVP
jgi:hypothetical protein